MVNIINYMETTAKSANQVAFAHASVDPSCKTNFADFIPATEWSVLAVVAVFLVRYVIRMNAKLLEEVCEDEDN